MSGPSAGYQFVGGTLANATEAHIGGGTTATHQAVGGPVITPGAAKFSMSGAVPGKAKVGELTQHRFLAAGGASPYTYSVQSGALPAGLALNTTQGLVTGTYTTAGTYTFVIRATDAASNIADSLSQTVVVA